MRLKVSLSARFVAILSLACWCCSLFLPGFTLYAENNVLFGVEILVLGVLSPLVLNFAWLANSFFLYGITCILQGRRPIISILLAILLSFDTVRFTTYPLNEGGTTSPVYGYGWGAILWFVAIFLLAAAAELQWRQKRVEQGISTDKVKRFITVGFILSAITLMSAAILSINDHLFANADELKRLSPLIAFKRTKVCREPDPVASKPLRKMSGPLQVAPMDRQSISYIYPFGEVKSLLEWGIPAVRIDKKDYYLSSGPKPELSSKVAEGPPSAVLHVGELSGKEITAKLVDSTTGRVVFDQVWSPEPDGISHCPTYTHFPRHDEQPRKFLMQALSLPNEEKLKKSAAQEDIFPLVQGAVIARKDGGITRRILMAQKYPNLAPSIAFAAHAHELTNKNCAADVGWDMNDYNVALNTGRPFMTGGVQHYLSSRSYANAFCNDQVVYIYEGKASDGNYYLKIEKRSVPDFRQLLASIVKFPVSVKKDDILKIQEIQNTVDSITFQLVHDDTGETFSVQAPLVSKIQGD